MSHQILTALDDLWAVIGIQGNALDPGTKRHFIQGLMVYIAMSPAERAGQSLWDAFPFLIRKELYLPAWAEGLKQIYLSEKDAWLAIACIATCRHLEIAYFPEKWDWKPKND